MFPIDKDGRISFIGEDATQGGGMRVRELPPRASGKPPGGQLVVMGRPAAASKPPVNNLYEMKKRLLQMASPAPSTHSSQERQQRGSLDRLPEMRKGLAATSSALSPSTLDRARGKSLSPTPLSSAPESSSGAAAAAAAAGAVELRRKERPPPLKPLSFPLAVDDKAMRGQDQPVPPVPPKGAPMAPSASNGEGACPKPRPPLLRPAPGASSSSTKPEVTDGDASPVKQGRVVPLTKSYKYRFLPGNNGRVILQAFRRRPWWHAINVDKNVDPASESEIVEYDFLWEMYRSAKRYKGESFKECCLNHIQHNHSLVTKKGLYFTLRNYCLAKSLNVLEIVPRTFYLHAEGRDDSHIGEGKQDDLDIFLDYNREMEKVSRAKNLPPPSTELVGVEGSVVVGEGGGAGATAVKGADSLSNDEVGVVWICKPASLTNRGFGITVLRGVEEVLALTKRAQSASSTGLEQARAEGTKPSPGALGKAARRRGAQEGWIVQEYLERPLLVQGRKFDIRCFVLLVMTKEKSKDSKLKAYFYEDAYVRTSCKKYTMDKLSDRECHLTNDAVQKHAKGYGKFESGNKLTMEEWQTSLEKDYPDSPSNVVFDSILPKIKRLSAMSVAAGISSAKLLKTDVSRSFELLGCKCPLVRFCRRWQLIFFLSCPPHPLILSPILSFL